MKKILLLLLAGSFLAAGCNSQSATTNQPAQPATEHKPVQTQPAPKYTLQFISTKFKRFGTDQPTSFDILANGAKVGSVSTAMLPPFDTDDVGNPANPATDYIFENNIGTNDFYDPVRDRIYFVAFNEATAGNANSDEAIYSYDLKTKKISILDQRSFAVSFGLYKLSPNAAFLVFSDGSHGGGCNDAQGLQIFDLRTNAEADKIMLPKDKVGYIDFNKWVNNATLQYTEYSWKDLNDCGQHPNPTAAVVKTFTIQD